MTKRRNTYSLRLTRKDGKVIVQSVRRTFNGRRLANLATLDPSDREAMKADIIKEVTKDYETYNMPTGVNA